MNNTPTVTFFTLIAAFKNGTPITLNYTKVIINSIEREDGSGKCFNVTAQNVSRPLTPPLRLFVRTID